MIQLQSDLQSESENLMGSEKQCNEKLTEIHDKRICFDNRRCCRKRRCCPCLVYAAIFFNGFTLVDQYSIFFYILFRYGFTAKGNEEEISEYGRIVKGLAFTVIVSWPIAFVSFVKIIYGCRWAKRQRQRKYFIAYYRLAITEATSSILFSLMYMFTSFTNISKQEAVWVYYPQIQWIFL